MAHEPEPADAPEAPRWGRSQTLLSLGVALSCALSLGSRGPLYWDSFGYVTQSLTGRPGGLALGRPLFVLLSSLLARAHLALGGSPFRVEPLLRSVWLAVSLLAAPLTGALAARLGFSPLSSLLAALLLATSPAWAHTAAAVLTDAPALTASLAALLFAHHATDPEPRAPLRDAALAGALWGAAFGLREQSLTLGLSLALLCARAPRSARLRVGLTLGLGALLAGALPVLYFAARSPGYLEVARGWFGAMQRERAAHPYGLRDAGFYLLWLVTLAPLGLLALPSAWAARRRELLSFRRGAFALVVPATMQLLALGFYQDISFSPRYLLPSLAGALALPAALALGARQELPRARLLALLCALLLPPLVGATWLRRREAPLRAAIDATPARLAALEGPHLLVTGQPCGAAELWDVARRRAEPSRRFTSSQRVCPGWGWPASLPARLGQARAEGRVLVLDERPGVWLGPRQQSALEEARRYFDAHPEGAREGWLLRWR